MDRRHFIFHSGQWVAGTSLINTGLLNHSLANPLDHPNDASHLFNKPDWNLINIVQNHFFPSELGAPGATEINALSYLHNYLSNPSTDSEEVQFILSGSRSLHSLAKQILAKNNLSNLEFINCSIEQREQILRQFEQQTEGRRWLVNILNYLLEALLTDPIYGGNPNGIGWQWLEHQAGEPRPLMNKRYWLL
jgi:gluconate 2-dehydrogenase gamma chain